MLKKKQASQTEGKKIAEKESAFPDVFADLYSDCPR